MPQPNGQSHRTQAVTVLCPWYPAARGYGSDPHRQGIEGFWILTHIPHRDNFLPCQFPVGVHLEMKKTLAEVNSTFDRSNNAAMRAEWDQWATKWAPDCDSSLLYINKIQANGQMFHRPLKNILLNENTTVQNYDWNMRAPATLHDDFKFPELLALATNSVVSTTNPHPPEPRIYSPTDEALALDVQKFLLLHDPYFVLHIKTMSNPALISLLRRKVLYSGEMQVLTGKNVFVHIGTTTHMR